MSDQNTNTQDQGTEATVKLHATRSEAEANKPDDATKNHKVYEVAKSGATVGFIWARGYDNALALTARSEGYAVSTGKTKEVTKEAILEKLGTLSDDELGALGPSRKKGGKR